MTHVLAKQAEAGAIEVADVAGDYVTDVDGNRYPDFAMGWCVGNLGWKLLAAANAKTSILDL